jgi:kynurenine 3-monooxygenase
MALLLARRGRSVRLIERRPDPRHRPPERGRSINLALAARGIVALEQAGLMARMRPHLVPMPGRMLHEADGRLRFLRYSHNEGELIHAVSRERLNRELIEAAGAQPGIELQFDARCIDVDPAAGILRIQDERGGSVRTASFELLLGADGAGSAVRSALQRHGLGEVRKEPLAHDYKELTIGARASSAPDAPNAPGARDAPAAAAAPGYLFEPHALHIWPRGGHMLIALPNADGSFTATLFLPRHGDPGFDRLRDGSAVRAFFAQQFADAAAVMTDLEQQFAAHPQGRLGTIHCQRWQLDGRALLLGDAAHAIVPFHGQGLNCGFEDCRVLDQLLDGTADPSAALARFEHERRPDTEAIAAMALENYVEMRDGVRSPQFAQRQALSAQLESRFPARFIPRYSMVMFHPEIPYAQAQRRGAQQQQLLDALSARFGFGPLQGEALAYAQQLLDRHGL